MSDHPDHPVDCERCGNRIPLSLAVEMFEVVNAYCVPYCPQCEDKEQIPAFRRLSRYCPQCEDKEQIAEDRDAEELDAIEGELSNLLTAHPLPLVLEALVNVAGDRTDREKSEKWRRATCYLFAAARHICVDFAS